MRSQESGQASPMLVASEKTDGRNSVGTFSADPKCLVAMTLTRRSLPDPGRLVEYPGDPTRAACPTPLCWSKVDPGDVGLNLTTMCGAGSTNAAPGTDGEHQVIDLFSARRSDGAWGQEARGMARFVGRVRGGGVSSNLTWLRPASLAP